MADVKTLRLLYADTWQKDGQTHL